MLPETEPRRKPRRLGLFGPFVALLIAAAAWSGGWYWLKGKVEGQMDAVAAQAKASGGELSWKTRTVGGFPFRMDVNLTGARAADGSGWSIEIPDLRGEAYPYSLNHWVFEAPGGATVMRPRVGFTPVMACAPGQPCGNAVPMGGDVSITGQVLRASVVVEKDQPFPRISLEGVKLTFVTPTGADLFWMQSVEHLEAHFRPGPNDQGALLIRLDGAKPRLTGLVARIAQDKPVNVVWDSTFTRASALKGRDWPTAIKSWRAAGGLLTISPSTNILAGDALFAVKSGELGVDGDGRLTGHLDTELKEAPRALAALAQTGAVDPATATAAAVTAATEQDASQTFKALLLFEDGKTKLGPLPLMESPRVY